MEFLKLEYHQVNKTQLQAEIENCINIENEALNKCSKIRNFLKNYFIIDTNKKLFDRTIIYLNLRKNNMQFCNLNLISNSYNTKYQILNYKYNDKEIDFNCTLLKNNKNLINEWYLIIISFIIKLALTILYLNDIFFLIITIVTFFFTLILTYFFNEILLTEKYTIYNLSIILFLIIINISDTYIWALCYKKQKRKYIVKTTATQQQPILTLDKILNDLIINVYYYLLPKSILYIVYFAIIYLNNKILIIKFYSAYGLITFILYFLLISLFYSTLFVFILKLNLLKYFKYLNVSFKSKAKLINKIKSLFIRLLIHYLTDLIVKFRVLWFVLFICASVTSVLSIFYAPKLYIASNILKTNSEWQITHKENISFYIVWGFDYHKTTTVDNERNLLNKEMMTEYYEKYKQISSFSTYILSYIKSHENESVSTDLSNKLDDYYYQNIKNLKISSFDCFIDRLVSFLSKKIKSGNTTGILTKEQYCNNLNSNSVNDTDVFKKVYAKCILYWSKKLQKNNDTILPDSQLFYTNTTLPSLYLIRVQTDIKYTQNFLNMQKIFNIIENWWLNAKKDLKLENNDIWWSSEQFESYALQYELNKTLIISLILPFIFIFLCVFLTTTNFFTAVYVTLTILLIQSSTVACTVWLDWRIDTLTCLLYVLVLFISTHYCLLYANFYRFTMNLSSLNRLVWSIRSIGVTLLLTTVNIVLSAIPLLFSSSQFLKKTAIVIILSSIFSYTYSTFFLQSLFGINNSFEHHYRFKRAIGNKSNSSNEDGNQEEILEENNKFSNAPSTLNATGSTYIEVELSSNCRQKGVLTQRCNALQAGNVYRKSEMNAKFLEIKNFNSSLFNPKFLMPNVYNSSVNRLGSSSPNSSNFQSDDSNLATSVASKSPSMTSTCI
jgi:hypothetical protein